MSAEEVAPRFRLGRQALAVYQNAGQNQRYGTLPPFVAITNSLDAAGYAAEVIDKAGIARVPYHWIRFHCATWLADGRGVESIQYGFRQPGAAFRFEETLRELLNGSADICFATSAKRADSTLPSNPFRIGSTVATAWRAGRM